MAFIKSKHKDIKGYKKSVQQDMMVFINTVHDEIDYIVDGYLLKALLKKVSEISTLKKTINKLGIPYLNFLFDIEYDKYNSWTSKTAIDIYQVARNRRELGSIKKFKSIIEGEKQEVVETVIEEIVVDGETIDIEKLLNLIDSSVKVGDVRLSVLVNGEKMVYKNLVNKKLLTEFLEKIE